MKKIEYLHNKQIDKIKWDACIQNAINSRIYAFSWYLDIVSKGWDCLMYGDYELVFPIVFKRVMFFKKIYQPLFCQQLGPFSINYKLLNDNLILSQIIFFLEKKYGHFEVSINCDSSNLVKKIVSNYRLNINCVDRINLELDLFTDYKKLFSNYNANTKRNLKNAFKYNLSIENMQKIDCFLDLFKNNTGVKAHLKEYEYNTIKSLISTCVEKKIGLLSGVYDRDGNLLACTFLISYLNRDVLLFNVSNKKFKHVNAMTFLLDAHIHKNAMKKKILDFEGSNISGVKRFYKGFGATETSYTYIIR